MNKTDFAALEEVYDHILEEEKLVEKMKAEIDKHFKGQLPEEHRVSARTKLLLRLLAESIMVCEAKGCKCGNKSGLQMLLKAQLFAATALLNLFDDEVENVLVERGLAERVGRRRDGKTS